MIGFYNRTVVLTYLSLASAVCGCIISCSGTGHPYLGGFFLLFCGLCDALDGRVARNKKDRSDREKVFGTQIDSLSDLAAFGILPSSIAVGLLANDGIVLLDSTQTTGEFWNDVAFLLIIFAYALAALIRLAYFNVLDEERRHSPNPDPACFIGMPVTMSALIFPLILLLNFYMPEDFSVLYSVMMLVVAALFLTPIKIRKPGPKLTYALIGIGFVEFVLMITVLGLHLH